MDIRIFGLANDSIVDGPGIRFAIFTQGCPHACEGCHNPNSHDMNGGYIDTTENILAKIKANPLLDGVTFSGGEPFMQAEPLIEIAKAVHEMGLNVVAFTGFLWENLLSGANEENHWKELLENIDILIDGPFILAQRSIDLFFAGSKNQRAIDVKESLEKGEIVIHEFN